MSKNNKILNHPLINDKLTLMRSTSTNNTTFAKLLKEISSLMVYELALSFPSLPKEVLTPLQSHMGSRLAKGVVLAPVLRAGLGMLEAVRELIPQSSVAFIGLKRDEKSLKPLCYYENFPQNLSKAQVVVLDPMLATGGSLIMAVDILKRQGAKDISYLGLLAAPEGLRALNAAHPEVRAIIAAMDERLDENGYIRPGLGDAGDRLYGL